MKINGLSVPGLVLAWIGMNAVSFLFYAGLFGGVWLHSYGLTSADAHAGAAAWRLGGPLAAAFIVTGLALVLKWRGSPGPAGALATGLVLGIFLALPVLIYDLAYLPDHNWVAFVVDAGHLLAGWGVAGLILGLVR